MYIRTHVELETDVLSNKGWYHRQFSMSFYWIFVEQSKCTYIHGNRNDRTNSERL